MKGRGESEEKERNREVTHDTQTLLCYDKEW